MSNVLVIGPSYKEHAAVSIRIHYFIEALKKAGINIDIYDYELRSKASRLIKYLFPRAPKDLQRKTKEADIIFTSSPPPLLAIMTSLLEGKHIIDVRDIWEAYAEQIYPSFLVRKITKKYYKALKNAKVVIVTTAATAKYYKEILDIEPFIIPNGTDPEIMICNKGISRDPNLIVILADFDTPYQNLDPLLKAITLIENAKLLIIGSGKHLPSYLSIAEKLGITSRVESIGHIPYNQISNYLCRASIGVVGRPFDLNPEYLYTIPTKIYDYLGTGLPIIAFGPQDSEIQQFIRENKVGMYLPNTTPEEISNNIFELLSKAEKMRPHILKIAGRYNRRKLGNSLVDIVNRV